MATYVCSDIHGQFNTWLLAIEKSGVRLSKGDNLVILGDLIDRGEDSLACVAYALELKKRFPKQVTYLMGNHERMFLDFVNVKDTKSVEGYNDLELLGEHWISNGGLETIHSFLSFLPKSLIEIHKQLNETYFEIIEQLNNLPYYKVDDVNKVVYVHAGFTSNIRLEEQDQLEMIWTRNEFYSRFQPITGDTLEGKLIIHGHTPVQMFKGYNGQGYYNGGHHLCVDGGSARNENVLMLKLEDYSYIEEKIPAY